MTYVKQSVARPTGNQGRSLMVHDEVRIIDVDDIKTMPSPDEGGVTITEDVEMKTGCYGIGIYLTPGTAEVTEPSEGDPDQEGFKPQVKFNHPGNTKELREFKHNWINRKVIVFIAYCDGTVDMIGTPCNPCRLQTSYTGNKDGNTNEITFAQSMKGDGIYVYEGTVPGEESKNPA